LKFQKYHTIKKPSNKKIIEVLQKTGGLLKPAAQKLNVDRRTVYVWIENSPELKQAMNDIRESMVDMSEGKLFKLINDENPSAIFFHLKTQGKSRGYVEKSEMDIKSQNDVFLDIMMRVEDENDN
jgi:hypothetical protein